MPNRKPLRDLVRLHSRFFYDHKDRDLDTPEVLHECGEYVYVDICRAPACRDPDPYDRRRIESAAGPDREEACGLA